MAHIKELKLLIVDDRIDYYDLIKECAELSNNSVHVVCKYAPTGEEALGLLGSWEPAVILLDLHSASHQGVELLRRCNEGLTRVIATSEASGPEVEKWAMQNGASHYVSKSEDPEEIEELLGQVEALSELSNTLH